MGNILQYDDNEGNRIEESSYRNGSLFTRIVFKYHIKANGKGIDEIEYDNQGYISRRNFKEYNSKGEEVKNIEYDSKGKEKRASLKTYNDKSFNIEWIYRWSDETGKDGFKWVSKFDNEGKALLENRYDLTNKLQSIYKLKYNQEGLNIGGVIETPNGGKISQHTNIYEGKLKIKEIDEDKDGLKVYKYNRFGDVIEYEGKTDTYRYDYNYDEKGNWTKIIEYRNTIPILVKERTITYYDELNKK